MIDTTSITDLLGFMVRDLEASGEVVHARDAGVQQVLEDVRPQPLGAVDLELDFSIEELASTLRTLGDGAEFMWPGSTTESAGLRLLLTHLNEQRASGHAPPRGQRRLSLHGSEPRLVPR